MSGRVQFLRRPLQTGLDCQHAAEHQTFNTLETVP